MVKTDCSKSDNDKKDDKKCFFHLFLVVHFCQGKNMNIFLKPRLFPI